MAIYTKTGDKGETKVFDKKTGQLIKISKTSCKIASIGAIDELNSFLGIVKSFDQNIGTQKKIQEIQADLFKINAIIAGGKLRFSKVRTKKLEKDIDNWEGSLPVQKNFIFYGGSIESSLLFYARALVRRAERSLVRFSKENKVSEAVSTYMNRLSDYLFMLGRIQNKLSGSSEKPWKR